MTRPNSEERQARMDAYDQKTLEIIGQHGWMLQGVFPTKESDGPPFVYTVGISLLEHPEFIVFGLPHQTAGVLLNDLGERVKSGQRFYPAQVLGDLVTGYDVRLVDVTDTTEHLTMANRMFSKGEPISALQVVWPDKDGRFPWDEGFAHPDVQPLLGKEPE